MNGSLTPALTPAERYELDRAVEEYHSLARAASARGLLDYLKFVVLDCRPEPAPFRLKGEPWQWAQAKTLAKALQRVTGHSETYSGPTRFWLEYPRGHDKSSSIGRYSNWLLAFAKRKNLRLLVAAGDRDQAAQIADFMKVEGSLNPWFSSDIKHQKYDVVGLNNGSQLKILAADAASAFGAKPDVLIVDELTHWPQREFWDALHSGMEKRPGSVTVVITNSGVKHSWHWDLLNHIKQDPTWFVYQAPGPLSKYMDQARVAKLAEALPQALADRVLKNIWTDPSGANTYVTRAEAQACEALGKLLGLRRTTQGQSGKRYVAAVDYGLVKDRTVLTVIHSERDPGDPRKQPMVHVDLMDVWQGVKGSPVQAQDIEDWIVDAQRAWPNLVTVCDPYQLEPVIQRLSRKYDIRRMEYRGGKSNYQAAANLLTLIRGKSLAWYPGCGDAHNREGVHTLVDEFAEAIARPMGYGYRIDHTPRGHDDRVVALAMAALVLGELDKNPVLTEHDWTDRWF